MYLSDLYCKFNLMKRIEKIFVSSKRKRELFHYTYIYSYIYFFMTKSLLFLFFSTMFIGVLPNKHL